MVADVEFMVQKIAEYSGVSVEEVPDMLKHASEKCMSIEEIRRWLDAVAYAVEEYIKEKYSISRGELEILVTVDPEGKYNSLEPCVEVGGFRIVLKDLIWDARWGDLLDEDGTVAELTEWADSIVEKYKEIKKKLTALEKS